MKKILCVLFGTFLIFTSCSDDDSTQPQETAPTIPPQSSMVMDFSEFPDTSSSEVSNKLTYQNWGWAAVNVVVWSSILKITLAIPVAAYLESFNHEPVLQPDGSWLWSYSVSAQDGNYTAKLFGKTTEAGVEWRMLISKEGSYTDFEWFTGFSNLPATEGMWTLNKDPNEPVSFLFIEWEQGTTSSAGEIKYTNITPGVVENGGYIHYGRTEVAVFNGFYNIYSNEKKNLTEIQWNFEFDNGRVKDGLHFGNTNWHCWDENLMDTDCL